MHEGSMLRVALDQLTEGQLRWQRLPDPYDEVALGPRRFHLRSGKTAFAAALEEQFPAERAAIAEFMRVSKVGAQGHLPVLVARPQGVVPGPLRLAVWVWGWCWWHRWVWVGLWVMGGRGWQLWWGGGREYGGNKGHGHGRDTGDGCVRDKRDGHGGDKSWGWWDLSGAGDMGSAGAVAGGRTWWPG